MDNRRRDEERDRRHFDGPRFEEHHEFHHKGDRPKKRVHVHKRPFPPRGKTTTKLLTSKEELVRYVNELGEKGHRIDVYKIEDGLYKVVVKERLVPHFEFDGENVELKVDIED